MDNVKETEIVTVRKFLIAWVTFLYKLQKYFQQKFVFLFFCFFVFFAKYKKPNRENTSVRQSEN